MSRYGLIAGVLGVLGAVGYVVEVAYFGDNETISSVWRILATSTVGVLLLTGIAFVVLGWRKSVR